MSVVMTGAGYFVEVQGTEEQTPFPRSGWIRCWRSPRPASAG